MRLLKLFLTLTIIFSCLIGDYVVFRSKYSESQLFRAAADSTVHATIGFLSALLFFTHRINLPLQTWIYYVLFCTLLSTIIDIDHVFVAKSIYLKDLTNLKQRGIFHCTTFLLLISTILFIYSYAAKKLNIFILTYMLLLAFTSHHIRDANRRGLWIYPCGHTPTINRYVYILLSAIMPYFYAYTFVYMKNVFNDNEFVLLETV